MNLIALIVFLTYTSFGVNSNCLCNKDTSYNEPLINCDTTVLRNNSILYWQYDCDKMWLTLENESKQKYVIDDIESALYGIHYRLVFQLLQEYENTLLFKYSCPANGPCNHILIDKTNGNEIKKIGELIDLSDNFDDSIQDINRFIMYFSNDNSHILVHFINSQKLLAIPFNEKLKYKLIPEYNFYEIRFENNKIELEYENEDDEIKIFFIDLSNDKYLVK